jgi:hypothetical protein
VVSRRAAYAAPESSKTVATPFGTKSIALNMQALAHYLSAAEYKVVEAGSNRNRLKPNVFGVLVFGRQFFRGSYEN